MATVTNLHLPPTCPLSPDSLGLQLSRFPSILSQFSQLEILKTTLDVNKDFGAMHPPHGAKTLQSDVWLTKYLSPQRMLPATHKQRPRRLQLSLPIGFPALCHAIWADVDSVMGVNPVSLGSSPVTLDGKPTSKGWKLSMAWMCLSLR